MLSQPYVRQLCDTIMSHQPLSSDQLFFLLDIVSAYMYEHDFDFFDDIYRAQLFLMEEID